MQDTITIEHPSVGAVNELTDMWVELAADQREYESYIQPEESREAVREMIAHRIASDWFMLHMLRQTARSRANPDPWLRDI
jgi:hypothetical protein